MFMKRAIVGITAGLIVALVFAMWWHVPEAITGIIGVLGTTAYKAYRVLNGESSSEKV